LPIITVTVLGALSELAIGFDFAQPHATAIPPQHAAQIMRGTTIRSTTAPAIIPPIAAIDKVTAEEEAEEAGNDEHAALTLGEDLKSEPTVLQRSVLQKNIL